MIEVEAMQHIVDIPILVDEAALRILEDGVLHLIGQKGVVVLVHVAEKKVDLLPIERIDTWNLKANTNQLWRK